MFEYPLGRAGGTVSLVKVSPLICYEDITPALAREATRRGAQVLVNQTHDARFGRTACPYQHHLISAFRAIENRRFLVRATSTGFSAVVDPLGRTVAHPPLYTESKAAVQVISVGISCGVPGNEACSGLLGVVTPLRPPHTPRPSGPDRRGTHRRETRPGHPRNRADGGGAPLLHQPALARNTLR
ncbi:MAG: nitrilase-related carbon-nitrogen hydrolase [Isosphaeraceae bacterium]